MSVRVVARIRPLLKSERDIDTIVTADTPPEAHAPSIVRIPNPKNPAEGYSFNFNRVYDQTATQQDLFDNEVAPTVKHLFAGFDVTLFAYGVTGTGKTHTMKGGKTLADRGVIPRLLSAMYRKQRKLEKDGGSRVELSFSYYEIYCDKVFDLLEPPEKRSPSGLPIRDNNGKTVVAGLTERACDSLREFEQLYDQANLNRSVGATKLNAQSSRSHAILSVKVTQRLEDRTLISTVSAIDLAGSEDNRRTDNGKERLVESSAINKSLFVLAQCVEAIGKKQHRIPYRESKMTRILSIGQNNGLTVMILNLAPIRAYHLDTISSLNFANRTKKIEVREVENEPIFKFKAPAKVDKDAVPAGPPVKRQPLMPLSSAANIGINSSLVPADKPAKAFAVYAEQERKRLSMKRLSDGSMVSMLARPSKVPRIGESTHSRIPTGRPPAPPPPVPTAAPALSSGISRADVEKLVQRMVEEKLAQRALDAPAAKPAGVSDEVQRRLALLEQRVEKADDGRAEGLQFLLMAKQHQVRGEEASALRMYQMALPFFPGNQKLANKIVKLQDSLRVKRERRETVAFGMDFALDSYGAPTGGDDGSSSWSKKNRRLTKHVQVNQSVDVFRDDGVEDDEEGERLAAGELTPRSSHLLRVINTRDISQIRSLQGVGEERAQSIVDCLMGLNDDQTGALVLDLEQLGSMKGLTAGRVEKMRLGIAV